MRACVQVSDFTLFDPREASTSASSGASSYITFATGSGDGSESLGENLKTIGFVGQVADGSPTRGLSPHLSLQGRS